MLFSVTQQSGSLADKDLHNAFPESGDCKGLFQVAALHLKG